MKNLEQLKEQDNKLWEEIENYTKIDFSKRIGRYWKTLAIRWNKTLSSFYNWDISYSNMFTCCILNSLHYEETTLDKLEKWDVFICKDDIENCTIEVFNILIWTDNDWDYRINFLKKLSWIEYIENEYISHNDTDRKVIKFLRN